MAASEAANLEHKRKLQREHMRRWRAQHPDKAKAAWGRANLARKIRGILSASEIQTR